MLVTVVARFAAGGPPGPAYHGEHCFTLNASNTATNDEVFDLARARAAERVANQYAMPRSQVTIKGVDLSREGG